MLHSIFVAEDGGELTKLEIALCLIYQNARRNKRYVFSRTDISEICFISADEISL